MKRITAAKLPTSPWWDIAAVTVLTVVFALLYGPGGLNFDAAWGLAWGVDIAHNGSLPDDLALSAPTSRPLATVVSALLALAGEPFAYLALEHLGFVALAVVVVLTIRLGTETLSLPAGLLAALFLLIAPVFVVTAQNSFQDLPFTASVLAAALLEVRRPRSGAPVLVLLAVAGVIRPQAWVLAAAYWLWLVADRPQRRRLVTFTVLAALGPALWLLFDTVVSGDPLTSLTRTRVGAELAHRTTGLGHVPGQAVLNLRMMFGLAAVLAGVAGFVIAAARIRREAAVVLALAVLGAVDFTLLGIAGLPLNDRYMLVPAVAVVLLAAYTLTGWLTEQDRRLRLGWAAGAVAFAVAIAIPVPDRLDLTRATAAALRARGAQEEDLRALARDPDTSAALRACDELWVTHYRALPAFAAAADYPPQAERARQTTAGTVPQRAAVVAATGPRARIDYVGIGVEPKPALVTPEGGRTAARSGEWELRTYGCGT